MNLWTSFTVSEIIKYKDADIKKHQNYSRQVFFKLKGSWNCAGNASSNRMIRCHINAAVEAPDEDDNDNLHGLIGRVPSTTNACNDGSEWWWRVAPLCRAKPKGSICSIHRCADAAFWLCRALHLTRWPGSGLTAHNVIYWFHERGI